MEIIVKNETIWEVVMIRDEIEAIEKIAINIGWTDVSDVCAHALMWRARVMELEVKLADAEAVIENYEAMKEGVTERINCAEARVRELEAQLAPCTCGYDTRIGRIADPGCLKHPVWKSKP